MARVASLLENPGKKGFVKTYATIKSLKILENKVFGLKNSEIGLLLVRSLKISGQESFLEIPSEKNVGHTLNQLGFNFEDLEVRLP